MKKYDLFNEKVRTFFRDSPIVSQGIDNQIITKGLFHSKKQPNFHRQKPKK